MLFREINSEKPKHTEGSQQQNNTKLLISETSMFMRAMAAKFALVPITYLIALCQSARLPVHLNF